MKAMQTMDIKKTVFRNLHEVCLQEVRNTKAHFAFVTSKLSEREVSKLMYEHILNCEDLIEFTSVFLEKDKDKEKVTVDERSLLYLKDKSELLMKYKNTLVEYNISTDIH
jgi:hypothetical protein